MDHKIFIQYWDGESLTTHAFYTETLYFNNTNDNDNDKRIHKIIYNGKEYKCFRTVGIFRYWLEKTLYAKYGRDKCLINKNIDCNIFNLHNVAVEIGCDCQYGCCYSCKLNRECGACCNTANSLIHKVK